ncbi:hypothetical protein RHGRI_016314 [Rhododendron griersonianum]|uniref:LOB domain-containing protein n=1 Tax=Rhododendron griersonianum TaxID=479676 RepID=A0AAV6JTT5_9ERIC|nr:hypothetical protein RHGRI_016314 [Rhododendron griersonianum]
MRTSCNACRVLQKGCSDECSLRPCLHWIKSSDSQSNATIFLAKFYGRASLLNLINAGPHHLHPDTYVYVHLLSSNHQYQKCYTLFLYNFSHRITKKI